MRRSSGGLKQSFSGANGKLPRVRCRLRFTLPAVALAALVGAASGAAAPASGATVAPTRPNLVLITLDTTRADRIGAYGHAAARTPNLDALARRGTRFARCDTAAPVTLPAHATLLTGLFPPRHGVRDNGIFALAPAAETLTERLAAAGYDTAAVVSAVVLARRHGLDQGFARYDDDLGAGYALGTEVAERTADAATAAALSALERLRPPFFLWVHYYDPHEEYRPPTRFAATGSGPDRLYEGEIAFVDEQVGELLKRLPSDDGRGGGRRPWRDARRARRGEPRPAPLRSRAAGASADGRAGGARRGGRPLSRAHGRRRADPGRARRRRAARGPRRPAAAAARRRGVRPDLLQRELPALLRLQVVSRCAPSRTAARSSCRRPGRRSTGSTWRRARRAIWRRRSPVSSGSGASGSAGCLPPRARRSPRPREPTARALAEQSRQLASLGYLGGAGAATAVSAELPDPRERVGVAAELHAAAGRIQRGECDTALRDLQRIVRDDPHNFPALTLAGQCLRDAGRHAEALALYERAARENELSAVPVVNAAGCLLALGRGAEAEREFRHALVLDPSLGDAAVPLARLLRESGRAAEAAAVLDRALAAGALAPAVFLERGLGRAEAGRIEPALADFREAARRAPTDPVPLENAARASFALGRAREAAILYETLLRLAPERGDVWKTLGAVYLEALDDREAALRAFRAAYRLEADPAERARLEAVLAGLGG